MTPRISVARILLVALLIWAFAGCKWGSAAPGAPVPATGQAGDIPKKTQADLEREVHETVVRRVIEGFESRDEIIAGVVDELAQEYDAVALRTAVVRLADLELAAQRERERLWTEPTDCDRLDQAFAALEKNGIIARQNYSDCQTCGVAQISEEMAKLHQAGKPVRGYVFYHEQDTEGAADGGLYLSYGAENGEGQDSVAVGRDIVRELDHHRLKTVWNGDLSERINVQLDWRRRRFTTAPRPWTEKIGEEVSLTGKRSVAIAQHLTLGVSGKAVAYLDLEDGTQIVIFTSEPLRCAGPAKVTGKVLEARGGSKRGSKIEDTSYVEYQLDVSRVECLEPQP